MSVFNITDIKDEDVRKVMVEASEKGRVIVEQTAGNCRLDSNSRIILGLGCILADLLKENAVLREAVAIEQERSLYWRKIAGRKEAQP